MHVTCAPGVSASNLCLDADQTVAVGPGQKHLAPASTLWPSQYLSASQKLVRLHPELYDTVCVPH